MCTWDVIDINPEEMLGWRRLGTPLSVRQPSIAPRSEPSSYYIHCVYIRKTALLILFRKIIVVYFNDHWKHVRSVFDHNGPQGFFYVNADFTCNYTVFKTAYKMDKTGIKKTYMAVNALLAWVIKWISQNLMQVPWHFHLLHIWLSVVTYGVPCAHHQGMWVNKGLDPLNLNSYTSWNESSGLRLTLPSSITFLEPSSTVPWKKRL
jgi:hypothetical protein